MESVFAGAGGLSSATLSGARVSRPAARAIGKRMRKLLVFIAVPWFDLGWTGLAPESFMVWAVWGRAERRRRAWGRRERGLRVWRQKRPERRAWGRERRRR